MFENEAISASRSLETTLLPSSEGEPVAAVTDCPTPLDVTVKIERIESDHDESTETEINIEPNVMTWISEESAVCRNNLQVKLTRLPLFLLKLFIKETNENDNEQIEERDKLESEELSDPVPDFKSKFRLSLSRLLASAFQHKPVVKEGSLETNMLKFKMNGTSGTHQIVELAATDINTPKPYKDTNKYVQRKSRKTSNTKHQSSVINSVREYPCTTCKYITNREGVYKKHLEAHSAAKKYICDTCSYIASRKLILIHHLRIHMGEKPFACEICNRKFTLGSDLYRHVRTHTSEKSYACEICHKKFAQLRYLKVHAKLHTGKKPYACEMCDKKFAQRCNLNLHIRTHTGEKPYVCKICHKKFRHHSILSNHVRTHTGEKPYACNICGKKMADSGNFTKHMQAHLGKKPYMIKRYAIKSSIHYIDYCKERKNNKLQKQTNELM